jgi:two-component system NtrC family response regulator
MSEDKRPLLVVEDDPGLQRQLRWAFEGYEVHVAGDRQEALALLEETGAKVATLDLGLPPDPDGASEGLATLNAILAADPMVKVIVVTGNEDRANALKAISLGAYDFYQKPINADVLGLIIDRAYRLFDLEEENRKLAAASQASPLKNVITGSPEMLRVCKMVERVAPADITILLLGASGTGKELLARALHDLSSRAKNPFVAINCAAIPENLLESELFGHEKGAFTGAVKQSIGKIETAQSGTLFLDEIGDLPLPLQVKLLRFLQERVIERIGGRKQIEVDVRIVCATHRDLHKAIEVGDFREDLFYRLSELIIDIPPLAERTGDIALLAYNFLNRFNQELSRSVRGFTGEALAALEAHNWPGNVRELENRLKRAVIMSDGKCIDVGDLDMAPASGAAPVLNLKQVREEADRTAIRRALAQADGNISQAAKLLGISRPTFYDLVKQYDISL